MDGEPVRTPVDLDAPAFAALTRVSLADDELALYVTLARDVDDGEAATLAVARMRGLTDDRKRDDSLRSRDSPCSEPRRSSVGPASI